MQSRNYCWRPHLTRIRPSWSGRQRCILNRFRTSQDHRPYSYHLSDKMVTYVTAAKSKLYHTLLTRVMQQERCSRSLQLIIMPKSEWRELYDAHTRTSSTTSRSQRLHFVPEFSEVSAPWPLIFSRSYCYTVWSAIGIILSSVRLSVCDAVHSGSEGWCTGPKVVPACS